MQLSTNSSLPPPPEQRSTLELDGRAASVEERLRAEQWVQLLEEVELALEDDTEAAQLMADRAELQARVLGETEAALAAARDAFGRDPSALHIARAYRKVALRAEDAGELITALEGEAAASKDPQYCASLHSLRGTLLSRRGNDSAAQEAFLTAVRANPNHVAALAALERLSAAQQVWPQAAEWAVRLAGAVTDPRLAAEHHARAAHHFERASDRPAALKQAAEASVHGLDSPSVQFLLERLYAAAGAFDKLVALRRKQIADGTVDACEGWFDVAVLAQYRIGDATLAGQAFDHALEAADPGSRVFILHALCSLAEQQEQWPRSIELASQRLVDETDPVARAMIYQRIATLKSEKLDDPEGAAEAFAGALNDAPTYAPALEDAARFFQRTGATSELANIYTLEAEASAQPRERAAALARAGALLAEAPERLEEAVALLFEALELAPDNLSAFAALERVLSRARRWQPLRSLYEAQLERVQESGRRAHLLTQLGLLVAERLEDRPRAIQALREAVELGAKGPPEAMRRLTQLLEDIGDLGGLADMLPRLAEFVEDPTEKASLFERLAALQERDGNAVAALESYRRAVAVAPPSHPVVAAATRAFMAAGRFEELTSMLEASDEQEDPGARSARLVRIGQIFERRLGEPERARERYEQALAAQPGSREAREALVDLLTRQQDWSALAAVLAGDTTHPAIVLQRAALAEALGEPAVAAELYGTAHSMGLRAARLPWLRMLADTADWAALAAAYGRGGHDQGKLHDGYRAAEVSLRYLGKPEQSREHLLEALKVDSTSLSAHLLMLPSADDDAETKLDSLGALCANVADSASRLDWGMQRAGAFDASEQHDEALTVRREMLPSHHRDPCLELAVEVAFELRQDRHGLAELLRRRSGDERAESTLRASAASTLGLVLEELGAPAEAARAHEQAMIVGSPTRWLSLLARPQLERALEDEPRYLAALDGLAERLPRGQPRAGVLRTLAERYRAAGRDDAACEALHAALESDPVDYEALRDLALLSEQQLEAANADGSAVAAQHKTVAAQHKAVVDALLRAVEAEERPKALVPLATHVAIQLIPSGRLELARETIDRVLALSPDDLRALMVLAELQQGAGEWQPAVATLDKVVSDEALLSHLRLEAIGRMVEIQIEGLNDVEAAKATAQRLSERGAADVDAARLQANILELTGQHRLAVESLEGLLGRPELSSQERCEVQLKLAALYEDQLDDPTAAIGALTKLVSAAHLQEAATRLLRLGERSGRWDLAGTALENALDAGGEMDPKWEIAIRTRLVDLLEGPLERPDGALRHLERIVELDPRDQKALERLADRAQAVAPEKALVYRRALIRAEPLRVESYQLLRQLFLSAEQEDGAFCAEAVLEGLKAANEEESYFYKQRRVRLARAWNGALQPPEHDALFAEMQQPAFQLLRALQPILDSVFAVDEAGYGLGAASTEPGEALKQVIDETATLFGVGAFRAVLVSPRFTPTVEPGPKPLLLLPRSLDDAILREQQFVCGVLMSRLAYGGIAADPGRINPTSAAHVGMLLEAACECALPAQQREAKALPVTAPQSPIYVDIRRRLDAALGQEGAPNEHRQAVADAANQVTSSSDLSGAALVEALSRASACAGLLAAHDPAEATDCFRRYRKMFATGAAEEAGVAAFELPPVAPHALAFAVSEAHLLMRARLRDERD